ncbi:hypothetical protein McanCB56680_005074 [Microsporum canis]|uniref:Uncharacterized protein n=1 Tax=Arthroderma otae (strain ATCC MYA-4605 / CBS 113480) TaxID=554155 RepID=C5FZY3_ARTOC|nr:uncharacterized protein MCYG_08255 [Microsporum canis CBS 113480]EEQ35436.1 predicted protein [Microsporum canis CBS 113480]
MTARISQNGPDIRLCPYFLDTVMNISDGLTAPPRMLTDKKWGLWEVSLDELGHRNLAFVTTHVLSHSGILVGHMRASGIPGLREGGGFTEVAHDGQFSLNNAVQNAGK